MAFIDKNDIKNEIDPSGNMTTDYDAYIAALVTYVLSLWDELTERTWASGTRTEYYSPKKHQSILLLENYPIVSITSIHDDPEGDYEDDTLISSDDYRYGDGKSGMVTYDSEFYESTYGVKIIYVAGYTDNNVSGWLKQILIRQTCYWWKQSEENGWHHGGKTTSAGTLNYNAFRNNLLPDFELLVERNRRI